MRRRSTLLALLLVTLSGCGSGSGSGTTDAGAADRSKDSSGAGDLGGSGGAAALEQPLRIVSAPPGAATVGAPYSFTLLPSGGTAPYRWAASMISPDGLSNGLAIDPATGAISGTPIYAGSFPLHVELRDDAGGSAIAEYLVSIGGTSGAKQYTNTPPAATQGSAYSFRFATSWTSSLGCSASTHNAWGKIPPGMSYDQLEGSFSGTPLTAGLFTFWQYADQSTLCTTSPTSTDLRAFTITVQPAAAPSSPRGASAWTRVGTGPVLGPTAGSWDSDHLSAPSVVKVGASYLMYYEGQGGAAHERRIGLATSTDGVSWTKSSANPVFGAGPAGSWDALEVRFPSVHHDGTTWRLWYSGRSDASALGSIGLATSSDGVHWTRRSTPVFGESSGSAPGSVLYEAGTFTMFYVDNWGTVGRATSSDGVSWTDRGSLTFDPGLSMDLGRPVAVADGAAWRLWYSRKGDAVGNSVFGDAAFADLTGSSTFNSSLQNTIASAVSTDGATWVPWSGNPVLVASNGWDGPGVAQPWVIVDGAGLKMYYAAGPILDSNARGAIGLATAP